MKKIMVYDVAAESGGALTVLLEYYNRAKHDNVNQYLFIVSNVNLPQYSNITVIQIPWIKKSWIHRLFCDNFYIRKIIKRERVTEILSLQNIGIRKPGVFQTVYVHNAIPFTPYKFSFLRETYLWVYQNIIGQIIKNSLKKADEIIVQTAWMKRVIIQSCKIKQNRIRIEKIIVPDIRHKRGITEPLFFYPASAHSFKNHSVVIEACQKINLSFDYKVIFTINPNKLSRKLKEKCEQGKLPIVFIGEIPKDQVNEYYQKSILLFPSYLETVGLPLIEAQYFDSPIIAADCEYAHDALGNYEKAAYFNPFNSDELSKVMVQMVELYAK